jgi:hypothetical protein
VGIDHAGSSEDDEEEPVVPAPKKTAAKQKKQQSKIPVKPKGKKAKGNDSRRVRDDDEAFENADEVEPDGLSPRRQVQRKKAMFWCITRFRDVASFHRLRIVPFFDVRKSPDSLKA